MYISCIHKCHLYYKCHQSPVTDDIHVHCDHRELLTVLILHMCTCLLVYMYINDSAVENCHSKFDLYTHYVYMNHIPVCAIEH